MVLNTAKVSAFAPLARHGRLEIRDSPLRPQRQIPGEKSEKCASFSSAHALAGLDMKEKLANQPKPVQEQRAATIV